MKRQLFAQAGVQLRRVDRRHEQLAQHRPDAHVHAVFIDAP